MSDSLLVLMRHEGEKVVITTPSGERIVVILVETRFHKAKLGFQADRSITITRSETE
jgi:sRNA-binding carbon storage regulator CsrA